MEYLYSLIYIILGAAYGLGLLFAYRLGLKDGMAVSKGQKPEPIKGPVAMAMEYKRDKEQQKQTDEIAQGLANLLSYNGDPQEKGGGK